MSRIEARTINTILAALCVASMAMRSPAGEPTPPSPAAPGTPAVAKLVKAKVELAREMHAEFVKGSKHTKPSVKELVEWSVWLRDAELEASTTEAARVAALEGHAHRLQHFEDDFRAKLQTKNTTYPIYAWVKYQSLDAETAVARAKGK